MTDAAVPAPVTAPVAAPAPVASAPAASPARPPAAAPEKVVTRRSYDTGAPVVAPGEVNGSRVAPRANLLAKAQAAADAARPPVVAKPVVSAAPAPAPVVEQVAIEPVAEAVEVEDVAAPVDEATKLSDAEFARRMARLTRQERRIAEQSQALAREQGDVKTLRERVQQIEKGSELAKRDPLGFMHRMFGVTPQAILDAVIAAEGKSPSAKSQDAQSDIAAKIAALEAQIAESAKATAHQQEQAKVRDYVSGTVAPILADKDAFAFVNHKFGASAPEEVYKVMYAAFERHGKAPTPLETAKFIESELRREAEASAKLLGRGAALTQTASPPKVPTPSAKPKVVAQTQPVVPAFGRARAVANPYVSKPRG